MRIPFYWRGCAERMRFATKVVHQNGNGPEIVEGFGSNLFKISNNGNGHSLEPISRTDLYVHKETTPSTPTIVYEAPLETKV